MAIVDFDTECWDDPFFQSLGPLARYLFMYLWTNPHKNIAGLYVITMETISNDTRLSLKQIKALLEEASRKVKYDPVSSVCWVVKHVRRQFLRTGIISEQCKKGIRKAVLKLHYHPFFQEFIDEYPEIFDPKEKETLYRPPIDPIDTVSIPPIYPPGGGGGGGGGSVLRTQNSMETLEEKRISINSKSPTLTDEEFIQALKKNPAYKGIDINTEMGKLDAWLLTPRAKGKKKTRGRIVNWLNRAEKPMEVQDGKPPTDVVAGRLWEIEQRRKNRNGTPDKNS